MALGVPQHSLALFLLGTVTAFGQKAPIFQPGPPGQASKTLTPSTVVVTPRPALRVDIDFMQGMIHHHAQAVEMVDLLRTRSRNRKVQALGNRISISQTDEMKFM